jgi:hypothetical protein
VSVRTPFSATPQLLKKSGSKKKRKKHDSVLTIMGITNSRL